jgi:tRNA(His) 5'-end guanylyltransferase
MTGKLLNETEAASFLGMAVATLRRWRSRPQKGAQLKFIKVGRCVRYSPDDLKKYLERRTQE